MVSTCYTPQARITIRVGQGIYNPTRIHEDRTDGLDTRTLCDVSALESEDQQVRKPSHLVQVQSPILTAPY